MLVGMPDRRGRQSRRRAEASIFAARPRPIQRPAAKIIMSWQNRRRAEIERREGDVISRVEIHGMLA